MGGAHGAADVGRAGAFLLAEPGIVDLAAAAALCHAAGRAGGGVHHRRRGWEVTNSNAFCGLVCHTMPPEYISYLNSPHSRVKCVECHIGRATIATQFTRKAHDISHVIKYLGTGYETPIYVKGLRPAQEICERCHTPSKFSADSTQVIKRYSAEENNALTETHLSFKIGGGSHREGLGKGIHWHIENNIEYIFTDDKNLQQEIPWVRVTNAETGESRSTRTRDRSAPRFCGDDDDQDHLRQMDCVTCHNRNSHEFMTPDDALDDAMARNVISPEIPYFKQNAMAVIEREYPSMGHAAAAIEGLKNYYAANWPDYYADNQAIGRSGGRANCQRALRADGLPKHGSHLDDAPQQRRTQGLGRLLPLSRWQASERAG
jgi:hypothetical protein